jgi:biopolymer transport protein ExbB
MDRSAGRSETRWAAFAAICLVTLLALFLAATPAVRAQDAAAPEAGDTTSAETVKATNLFFHIAKSAGWFFGGLLFLVSVGLVALIVILAMDLRMPVAIPPTFVEEFADTVNKRKFKEAFELTRNDASFLGRVLTVGMARLQYGIEDAREAAVNTVESLKASREQLITYLATIGTLGPMLGLVGTVYGMILSFMELSSGTAPKPAKLADGISHALVVTLLGIALSVPAIFCHAFFRNRLIRISMDVSNLADDLLTQMYHNSKRPGVAAPAEAVESVPIAAPADKKDAKKVKDSKVSPAGPADRVAFGKPVSEE